MSLEVTNYQTSTTERRTTIQLRRLTITIDLDTAGMLRDTAPLPPASELLDVVRLALGEILYQGLLDDRERVKKKT